MKYLKSFNENIDILNGNLWISMTQEEKDSYFPNPVPKSISNGDFKRLEYIIKKISNKYLLEKIEYKDGKFCIRIKKKKGFWINEEVYFNLWFMGDEYFMIRRSKRENTDARSTIHQFLSKHKSLIGLKYTYWYVDGFDGLEDILKMIL